MSLADLIRNSVALANDLTKDGGLQEVVSLKRWKGVQDDYGKPSYAAAISLDALVEHRRRIVRSVADEDSVSVTTVTVLGPIPALSPVVVGRKEPVDERDLVTLANGTTAPIIATDGGLSDPTTARGYLTQIYLG